MRILYLCGREPDYIRNLMLRRALRRSFDVVEITSAARRAPVRHLSVGLRYLHARRSSFDLVVVGFYGQPLLPWVRLWTQAPILFDPYISTYDTLCFDRQWFRPGSLAGRLAYALDRWTCHQADHLLFDTAAHRDYFVQTFGLPADGGDVVYVGCDEALFSPRPPATPDHGFEVFTYTSFLRLHGVEHILDAARLLRGQHDVHFTIAGTGSGRARMERLAADLGLDNVRFPGWLPFASLPERIAAADLCLGGHFANVDKARRVISTKTYQFLAMAKPVIAGDNQANREALVHGRHAWLCPMASGQALAEAIHTLRHDGALREAISRGGRCLFEERFSLDVQAAQLREIIETRWGQSARRNPSWGA
jgi:glycosyltransferase involved in cell wall biosynthesis